jgi:hypothetical protein
MRYRMSVAPVAGYSCVCGPLGLGDAAAVRGGDSTCDSLFSFIGIEKRARADYPLWVIREIANAALKSLSGEFAKLYSPICQASIPPERLMHDLLL